MPERAAALYGSLSSETEGGGEFIRECRRHRELIDEGRDEAEFLEARCLSGLADKVKQAVLFDMEGDEVADGEGGALDLFGYGAMPRQLAKGEVRGAKIGCGGDVN